MKVKHDGDLKIAYGASRYASKWKNKTVRWSALLDQISTTTKTRETMAEYRAMPKSKQDAVKDIGGFVGGWLKQGRRKAGYLESRSIITLDADFAQSDLLDAFELLFGNAAAVYSTHKHTPEKPRLRLIVPLSRTVGADEYQAAARKLAEALGIDQFDDTTYQPTRMMYLPSTSIDGEFYFDHRDGDFLDPDMLLAQYPDWRDMSFWPESSRCVMVRKKTADKQGNPEEKAGLVGAFCRAYDIEGAIERFLPDQYTPCDAAGRYTYTGGSTSAGLVVYDGGLFAYSNHATDPAGGRLCNAFDLVRLHLYGAQDIDVSEDTPVNKLPSFAAMTELAQSDERVKTQLVSERLRAAQEDFDSPIPAVSNTVEDEDDDKWMAELTVDKTGRVMSTINNIYHILCHDPELKGRLAYNDFKSRLVARKDLPWRKIADPVNGDAWTDADDSELRRYLELAYGINSKDRTTDAVTSAARTSVFHPVRDYLATLRWDGTERLDTLLVDHLGAADVPYVRAVTRKVFTAAVARIMEPGRKFDYILVLSGPQGRGKSTLVARMARGWFNDSLAGIGTKEAYEGLQGFWLIELGELAAMRKTEIETIKNFISKQVDSYRAPYGRRVEDHPRQCVFIGTTNATEFLRDDTGNRRFWPVRLGEAAPEKTVWDDLTPDVVDQLWAEAVARWEAHEPLTLPVELARDIAEVQADFTEEDPRSGQVQLYLDTPLPADWGTMDKLARVSWFAEDPGMRVAGTQQRDRVCVAEIWAECFGRDAGGLKRQDTNEIRAIMRRMRGWKLSDGKLWCGPYGSQRCFIRIADSRGDHRQ